MPDFAQTAKEQIDQIISNFPTREAALLPLFHLAHKKCGKINDKVIKEISELVNLPCELVEQSFQHYRMFWPDR